MACRLDNGVITLLLDDDGKLSGITHASIGINPLRPYCLWRAVMEYDSRREVELRPSGKAEVLAGADRAELHFTECVTRKGEKFPIDVRCTITLEGEEIRFASTVRNLLEGSVLREFQYPVLGVKRGLAHMSIIDSIEGGERYNDFYDNIQKWRTAYCQQDNKYLRRQYLYPGLVGAMNCFVLDFRTWGIYYGCHDPGFDSTMHIMELEQETEELNLYMVRYPFLAPGEEWSEGNFVIAPYSGSWHHAARKYRAWAESTWYNPPEIPASVKKSEGWQRLCAAVRSTWPEAIVSPYLMLAGSDSRHYGRISRNVYRFGPLELTKEERGTIHGNDERVPLHKLIKCAEFYLRLIRSC